MNFGPWGESSGMDQGDSRQQASSGNGVDPHGVQPEGSERVINLMEHTGVVCDNCDKPILGFRYKCLRCADYDLCATCEHRGLHAGHVMMRIAFPEQAQDAIRSFCSAPDALRQEGCGPSPACGHFRHMHHGLGKSHKKHGKRDRSSDSSDDDSNTLPDNAGLHMSKKELKRLNKCIRKASHHGRKSAEAFAQAASNAAGRSLTDYSGVIRQIQEYLNAFGIPIDVVTMYDEFGNQATTGAANTGIGTQAGASTSEAATATDQNGTNIPIQVDVGGIATPVTNTGNTQEKGSTSIVNQMQDLNIENGNRSRSDSQSGLSAFGSLSRSESVSASVDLINPSGAVEAEGDADWTMLEDEKVVDVPPPVPTQVSGVAAAHSGHTDVNASAPPLVDIASNNTTPMNSFGQHDLTDQSDQVPINNAPAPEIPRPSTTPTSTSTPASTPLYPVLPIPEAMQQIVNGVTGRINQAFRNLPARPAAAPAPPPPQQQAIPLLDVRMQITLNQLLSMGFSNHDGWLARLVASKNGDLDAVLNSLFPAEQR